MSDIVKQLADKFNLSSTMLNTIISKLGMSENSVETFLSSNPEIVNKINSVDPSILTNITKQVTSMDSESLKSSLSGILNSTGSETKVATPEENVLGETNIPPSFSETNGLEVNNNNNNNTTTEAPGLMSKISSLIGTTEVQDMLSSFSSTDEDKPSMMEHLSSVMNTEEGKDILSSMGKSGLIPPHLKNQIQKNQHLLKNLPKPRKKQPMKNVLYISQSRVLRTKSIPVALTQTSINTLLNCKTPLELPAKALSIGPLTDKNISIWYNPTIKGKNRRATKLVGLNVGSDIVIVNNEGDLSETDFLEVEKML